MLPLGCLEESHVPTPRDIRQIVTRMAQSWGNEPVGIGLRPSCLQDIHHLPQSTNSFISINQVQPVPLSNISPSGLEHNLEWSAPFWLSNLCQIVDLTVRYPKSLPKENLNRSITPFLVPGCTLKQQPPSLSRQTGEETAVVYLSKETKCRYARIRLFTFLTTSSRFCSTLFYTIIFPVAFVIGDHSTISAP